MVEIIATVKPVFEVISDGDFDEKGSMTERVSVKYCYNCGSPLMYIRQERKYQNKSSQTDFTWYCAVCGACQMGVTIDDPPIIEKKKKSGGKN